MEISELVEWTFKMAVFFLLGRAILRDRGEAQRNPESFPADVENEQGQSE